MTRVITAAIAVLCLISLPGARAQELEPGKILPEAIEAPDGPVVDTALVFTNLGNADTKVSMKVWNAKGESLAFGEVKIPGNGLTYVFASRFAEQAGVEGFVGKVEARGPGHLTGSAVLLGGPLTDLPTINRVYRLPSPSTRPSTDAVSSNSLATRITFPLIATY